MHYQEFNLENWKSLGPFFEPPEARRAEADEVGQRRPERPKGAPCFTFDFFFPHTWKDQHFFHNPIYIYMYTKNDPPYFSCRNFQKRHFLTFFFQTRFSWKCLSRLTSYSRLGRFWRAICCMRAKKSNKFTKYLFCYSRETQN